MSLILSEPTVGVLTGPLHLHAHRLCSFQRRDYAPIEIVQTEMKGFGLRAAADLPKYAFSLSTQYSWAHACSRDTFIYEYLGDVVSQPTFLKRMRQYAEEGIRHFYFMMLQKDEVSYSRDFPL